MTESCFKQEKVIPTPEVVLLPRPPPSIYSHFTKMNAGWFTHPDQTQEAKEQHSTRPWTPQNCKWWFSNHKSYRNPHFLALSLKTASRKLVLTHVDGTITNPINASGHSGTPGYGLDCSVSKSSEYMRYTRTHRAKKMFSSSQDIKDQVAEDCCISPTKKTFGSNFL